MGKLFKEYIDGDRVYVCSSCRVHLTTQQDIYSKAFQGRSGRAYLFHSAVNVSFGPPEDRILMTGLHTVRDMFCKSCNQALGWTYDEAYEDSQKYKEGKFIIEKAYMRKEGKEDGGGGW